MSKVSLLAATAALGLVLTGPVQARVGHYHRHHHRHFYVNQYNEVEGGTDRSEVIGSNALGDVIISGETGLHRSDFGVMVPDSVPTGFIAAGRASRVGISDANGTPGRNFQH